MRDIADLVVIVWASLFGVSWLWRVTDPDPTRGRVRLSQAEISASQEREPWARAQLVQLATAAGLRSVPSFGVANAGAYYIPLRHRIQVSHAYLARLSDAELRLILAHEVGHATRRWKAFARRSPDEEVAADRVALRITGSTPDQWRYAVESTGRAEPGQIVGEDVVHRASALGLQGESCRSSVPK